jgi:hypothetical protein
MRRRPSPALIVALLALFVALAGTGYAAFKLPRNSVGSRQIRTGAVQSSDVRNRSLLAKDFMRGQLRRGPAGPGGLTGARGLTGPAGRPGTDVAAVGPVRLVGAAGQPAFGSGWRSVSADDPTYAPAGFFKDATGVVHLEGSVKAVSLVAPEIFVLPPGYRPSGREGFSTPGLGTTGSVDVKADGTVGFNTGTVAFVSLSGIVFRAAP